MTKFTGKIWEGCSVFGFDFSLTPEMRARVIFDAENDGHKSGEVWKVEVVIKAEEYIIFDNNEIFYSEDVMGLMYQDRIKF